MSRTWKFLIFFYFLASNLFAQHTPGTYTIDELNQRDDKGRKQGYWTVYVDSSFNVVDSSKHNFCFFQYMYNERTFEWYFRFNNKRYEQTFLLDTTIIDNRVMISGMVISRLKKLDSFQGWILLFNKGRIIERIMIIEHNNYIESISFNKKSIENDASCYLNALYYGTRRQEGHYEFVRKRKAIKNIQKSRVSKEAGKVIFRKLFDQYFQPQK